MEDYGGLLASLQTEEEEHMQDTLRGMLSFSLDSHIQLMGWDVLGLGLTVLHRLSIISSHPYPCPSSPSRSLSPPYPLIVSR